MKKIDISVVIPAYNVEAYIGCMIDCLLKQSFKNFEIIVVDDCSKDNTLNVLNEYSDERLRVIKRNENSGGCYIPREEAVLSANGEWIVYVDADDYVEKTYLSELFERVNAYKVDVCSPQMIRVNDKLEPEPNGWYVPKNDFDFDRVFTNIEAFDLTVPDWKIGMNGAIVRKTVFVNALNSFRKEGKRAARSDEMLSRVILLSSNGYIAAKTKYYYRYNQNSITTKFNLRYFEWIDSIADFMEYVKRELGENSKQYRNVFIYDFLCYFRSFLFFSKQVDDLFSLKKGLLYLKGWSKRQKWWGIIKDADNLKLKAKIILCSNFYLSVIFFFVRSRRYSLILPAIRECLCLKIL